MRSIGEMDFSDNLAGIGVDDVDVVGRATLAGRNIEQFSVRTDRQPIDAGTDRFIPEDSVVINIQTIGHSGARTVRVGNISFPVTGLAATPLTLPTSGTVRMVLISRCSAAMS